MPLDSKHIEAHFSLKSTDSLHLQPAHLSRSQDLAISVSTTTTITEPITLPHIHACGVKLIGTPVTYCNVAMTANLHIYNYVVGHNSVPHVDQYIPYYYLMAMYI